LKGLNRSNKKLNNPKYNDLNILEIRNGSNNIVMEFINSNDSLNEKINAA
jgi:hypothetical protein